MVASRNFQALREQVSSLLAGLGSAATLTTPRTFSFTGDIAGGPTSFDGSANVSTALTLPVVNANVGAFGSGTLVPVITVNAKGQVTAITTTAVAASGSGTVTSVGSGTGLTGGPIVGAGSLSLAPIADVSVLANTSGGSAAPVATAISALAGVGSALKWTTARALSFTGDVTGSGSVDGSADVATGLTLATVNANVGSFGSATAAATFTVDAKGRLTAAGAATVTPAYTSITSIPAAIDAIDGLTPAADRVAYYTGAASAALATLTVFARTLLDDGDAATARTTLELGSLATASSITSGSVTDFSTAADARVAAAVGVTVQGYDADLAAIGAIAGTLGLLKKTAANTWSLDTSAYITGITGPMVTAALGFTPLDAAAASFAGSAAKWTTSRTLTLGTDLTGNVAFDGSANFTLNATVAVNSITYAKMQDITAAQRVLGRNTALAGDPEEVTLTQLLDWIGSAAQGDLLYRGSASWARLAAGTAGQVLMTGGAAANPSWASAPRLLARRTTASGAIANTETVVLSGSIAANTLAVGSVIRLQAVGVMTNTTTATTSTWRIRIGPNTLTGVIPASAAFVNTTTARTNVIVCVDALVLITAIGASGTAHGQIIPTYGSTGAAPPAGVTAAVTINTTVLNLAEFTFISGGASTTANFHSAVLELIS